MPITKFVVIAIGTADSVLCFYYRICDKIYYILVYFNFIIDNCVIVYIIVLSVRFMFNMKCIPL